MERVRARVRQKMSAKHLSQVTGEISKRKYAGCFVVDGLSWTKMRGSDDCCSIQNVCSCLVFVMHL